MAVSIHVKNILKASKYNHNNFNWSLYFVLTSMLIMCFNFSTYSNVFAGSNNIDPELDEMYKKISQSKTIGVFTKLSIQNNATRLNKSFEEHHNGKRPPDIKELRERYDLMVQEMMILVQGKDPELAREIYETRLLLWSYLSDPEKYKSI
jgi:hypothetical protein